MFQKAADKGNDEAAIKLANMHLDGEGVPNDFARVFQLATAPAAKGDARAQFALAFAHANASGPDQEIKAAADWYRKAALNDKPWDDGKRASVALGDMYEQGQGVEQDPAKAREWFARAATQDSAKGKYKTAFYLIQDATPEALTKAASYLAEAVDEGQAEALSRLAQGFDGINDPLRPVLIAPSPYLATWFETLGRGFEEVRIDCAIILTVCDRVGRQQLDLVAAARWYRRASMHGSAQFRLGRLLLNHPDLAQTENEGATILKALDMPEARMLTDVTGKNADAAFEQVPGWSRFDRSGACRRAVGHRAPRGCGNGAGLALVAKPV